MIGFFKSFILLMGLCFFSLLSIKTFSQDTQYLDSLKTASRNTEISDTLRAKAIYSIAWNVFRLNNPDSMFYYASKARDFAKEKGIQNKLGDALNAMGTSKLMIGEMDSAIFYYDQSFGVFEGIDHTQGKGFVFNNKARVFFAQGDYEKSEEMYDEGIKLYQSIGDSAGIVIAEINKGHLYNEIGKTAEAIEVFEESLKKMVNSQDYESLAGTYLSLGNSYSIQGNSDFAIKNYELALHNFQLGKSEIGQGLSFLNMSNVYHNLGDPEMSVEFGKRSLEFFEKLKARKQITLSLLNMGKSYLELDSLERAESIFNRSLTLSTDMDDKHGIGLGLIGIAHVRLLSKSFLEAESYFNEALIIVEEINNEAAMVDVYNGLSETFLEQGKYPEAIENAKKAKVISVNQNDHRSTGYALENLYKIYKNQSKFAEALEVHEELMSHSENRLSDENTRDLARVEYQYEYTQRAIRDSLDYVYQKKIITAESNEKIAKANNKIQRIYWSTGLALLAAIFAIIFVRYRSKQKKIEEEIKRKSELTELHLKSHRSELKAIQSQLNPHFIFNSLMSIKRKVKNESVEDSEEYILKYSRLIRDTLDSSSKMSVYLSDEIELIKHYLDVEQANESRKFEYRITIDENIQQDDIRVPPMLIQPILENSILHGFANGNDNNLLTISYSLEKNNLVIDISDNGVGIMSKKKSSIDVERKSSVGTSLVRERLSLWEAMTSGKASFKTFSGDENQSTIGTTVLIKLTV